MSLPFARFFEGMVALRPVHGASGLLPLPAFLRTWCPCRLHGLDKGVCFVNFLSLKNGLAQPCKQLLKRCVHPLFRFVSSPLGLPQRPFPVLEAWLWPSTTPFSVLEAWLLAFHNAPFQSSKHGFGSSTTPFSVLEAWLWAFKCTWIGP